MEDLIQIKGTPGFAVSNQTTWLSGDDGVVKNMGNITSDAFAALRVRNLIVDNTNPVLKTFVLNLDASTLTLEATEPLETSDFQVECIALSSDGDQTSLVNLTGSEAITQNGQFTIINMTATDLEALKLSNFTTTAFLYTSCSLTTDTNDNPLPVVSGLDGTIIGDITKPLLESWGISMDDGLASFKFSEPMSISTLKKHLFKVLGLPLASADEEALSDAP